MARAPGGGDLNRVFRVLAIVLSCVAAAVIAPASVAAFSSAPAHAKRVAAHTTRKSKRRCRVLKAHGKRHRRPSRCKAVKTAKLRARTAAAKRRAATAKAAQARKTAPSKRPTTTKPPTTTTTSPAPPVTSSSPPASGAQASGPWPVASHIETWGLDDCGQGSGTATSLVRQWLSYAETNCGPGWDGKALSDCHLNGTTYCNVIQYLDTNWIYPGGSPPWNAFHAAAPESWYQHTPGSQTNRVTTSAFGGGYLINQSNPGVQSFFQSYVRSNYGSDDGLMMDDQAPGLSIQLWGSSCNCSATNEIGSSSALRSVHGTMSAALTHASGQPYLQIDNTLPANPWLPQGMDMLNDSAGVHGLLKEGSPEYNGSLDPYYSTLLDEIAYVADNTNDFVVTLSYGDPGASYQTQSRRVQEGTMLLGYTPGHLVDWENLQQGNNDLGVWPEEGIYPTGPIQSMGSPAGSGCLAGTGSVCPSGGHNDLQVAPGVYRREFTNCYKQGASFGPCAAIVNTTSSAVTVSRSWLAQSYGHQITFNGGDVQAGGTLNLAGAGFTAGASAIGAKDAALLTP